MDAMLRRILIGTKLSLNGLAIKVFLNYKPEVKE